MLKSIRPAFLEQFVCYRGNICVVCRDKNILGARDFSCVACGFGLRPNPKHVRRIIKVKNCFAEDVALCVRANATFKTQANPRMWRKRKHYSV